MEGMQGSRTGTAIRIALLLRVCHLQIAAVRCSRHCCSISFATGSRCRSITCHRHPWQHRQRHARGKIIRIDRDAGLGTCGAVLGGRLVKSVSWSGRQAARKTGKQARQSCCRHLSWRRGSAPDAAPGGGAGPEGGGGLQLPALAGCACRGRCGAWRGCHPGRRQAAP